VCCPLLDLLERYMCFDFVLNLFQKKLAIGVSGCVLKPILLRLHSSTVSIFLKKMVYVVTALQYSTAYMADSSCCR